MIKTKQTNKNSSFIFICVYMHASSVASVMSNSLWPYGLQPRVYRLLCPWDSPDMNTGVGCHVLLQGIFQHRDRTHISCPLHGQVSSLPLVPQGKPNSLSTSHLLTLFILTALWGRLNYCIYIRRNWSSTCPDHTSMWKIHSTLVKDMRC